MIVGITGYARSGKDTTGHVFEVNGWTRYGFADPIKRALREMFYFSDKQLWGEEKDQVDGRYGISPRQLLQYFGTELAQYSLPQEYEDFNKLIGRNLWAKRFEFEYRSSQKDCVITDVRFPHEVDMIHQLGGKMVRVVRDSVTPVDTKNLHESEKHIPQLDCDWEINNNWDLRDLYQQCERILWELGGKNG